MRIRSLLFLIAAMYLISTLPLTGEDDANTYLEKAAKPFPLPDLVNPDSITAQNNKLYITDSESVCIYDGEKLLLLRKFGKKGEGSGEFRFAPGGTVKLGLCLTSDRIMVNSMNRVHFSSSGK